MATVSSVRPNIIYQDDSPELSPVAFFRIYAKMHPVNTPRQTLSWVYDPKVPEISFGDSSLTMSGAMALKKPTQKPWQILKKTSVGKYLM